MEPGVQMMASLHEAIDMSGEGSLDADVQQTDSPDSDRPSNPEKDYLISKMTQRKKKMYLMIILML